MSSDASANGNVIVPMKHMGLLDDENKPTKLANDWRIDDSYKNVCDTIITNVYPTEFLELFSDSPIDRTSVRNWFMSKGVGRAAADKMVALFMLLKEGVVKEKKVKSLPKKKTSVSAKTSKAETVASSTEVNTEVQHETKDINGGTVSDKPNLHIDLQIHISPDSTPEQIETIFSSMAKHLYGVNNS